ncbi:MAG: biopolymer transporter ExbD [Methylocystaceae bacterium]|nr:biopolymer transporter ExbD [Methylocystaceae bacterium]
MQLVSQRQPKRLISLTPLIDVVFILLVFFMISSNFVEWKRLPVQSTQQGASAGTSKNNLLIVITERHLKINDAVVSRGDIKERLDTLAQRSPVQVFLRAEKNIDLQRTVQVIDWLGQNGIEKTTLVP